MDEDCTASLFPLIILSVYSSHRPHAPRGIWATTIRMAAGQSECKIGGNPFFPCLRTAAVLLHSSFRHCVCSARMILLFLVLCRPIGHTSSASGHVYFCLGPATLHGGCAGLRGRWEGDGVTDLIASARLCVSGRGGDRLWLDASVCHCVWLLLLLPLPSSSLPFLTKHLELFWLDQHNYRFKVLGFTRSIRISSGIAIYRNCVSVFAICRKGFAKREDWSTGRA
ncbi:hypothetical protein ECC02_003541 [Trypanosoma cruzi]|uniref:Uncharacterized protein n=1 Tax=Trypanosoma cruzi TaxID=5693 RepID=A0A7J6YB50_TRYCR|nr:hypothetical protein ECC02_003541 [Trypanosoma cruzi]